MKDASDWWDELNADAAWHTDVKFIRSIQVDALRHAIAVVQEESRTNALLILDHEAYVLENK